MDGITGWLAGSAELVAAVNNGYIVDRYDTLTSIVSSKGYATTDFRIRAIHCFARERVEWLYGPHHITFMHFLSTISVHISGFRHLFCKWHIEL